MDTKIISDIISTINKYPVDKQTDMSEIQLNIIPKILGYWEYGFGTVSFSKKESILYSEDRGFNCSDFYGQPADMDAVVDRDLVLVAYFSISSGGGGNIGGGEGTGGGIV